jgi:outer membrane biosynthesis protein TonB
MRVRVAAALVGCAIAVMAAGCSNRPGDLSAAAEKVLAPKVQQIRVIAASGDYDRLARAVAQLKVLVEREKSLGQVSAQRAVAIEDAADTLLNDLTPVPTTTPTPTPTITTPSPTPTPTPTPTPSPTETTPTPTPSPTETTPTPLVTISG